MGQKGQSDNIGLIFAEVPSWGAWSQPKIQKLLKSHAVAELYLEQATQSTGKHGSGQLPDEGEIRTILDSRRKPKPSPSLQNRLKQQLSEIGQDEPDTSVLIDLLTLSLSKTVAEFLKERAYGGFPVREAFLGIDPAVQYLILGNCIQSHTTFLKKLYPNRSKNKPVTNKQLRSYHQDWSKTQGWEISSGLIPEKEEAIYRFMIGCLDEIPEAKPLLDETQQAGKGLGLLGLPRAPLAGKGSNRQKLIAALHLSALSKVSQAKNQLGYNQPAEQWSEYLNSQDIGKKLAFKISQKVLYRRIPPMFLSLAQISELLARKRSCISKTRSQAGKTGNRSRWSSDNPRPS
jgi:hypothetical protein